MRALVFSNFYIAVAGLLLTHQTYLQLRVPTEWGPLPLFVFSATLAVYNLDRLSGASDEDHVAASERHRWIDAHRSTLWGLATLGGLGALALLPMLPSRIWLALIPLGLLSLGYSLPLVWGREGPYRLKDVAGLKIVLIACVWAGATGVLPAIEHLDALDHSAVILVAVERGLYIFALTLPFDLRDLERDREAGIRTIPMYLGARPTRWLAVALMGGWIVLVTWHYGWSTTSWTPPLVASAGLTAATLARGGEDRDELYYVGLLDGMMIVQWMLVAGWSLGGGV